MATGEKLSSRGNSWFCTTGLPSDIVVQLDDMNFHLHKIPLMSKSRKLHQLITEQEQDEEEEEGEEDVQHHLHLALTDFPGGSEAFELAVKFCYDVKIDLSSSNVASLRCAGEFLEMAEEYSEDNLISKTEQFLSRSVLNSVKDSITTLQSCERLMPLAETLEITKRCIASIVSAASSADPALFSWPVSDSASKQSLEVGIRRGRRRNGEEDAWFEEISVIGLPLFKQLILAMRASELKPEVIETCLIHYAKKRIPGLSRSNRKPLISSSSSEVEQKELLETVISNLPLEKTSKPSTATRYFFGLLRTANILKASEECRHILEKKIGSQLEEATLDDLLIPSYSYLNETLYDVDCAARILGHFLQQERNAAANDGGVSRLPALMLVGKLIDGYLAEIASDANLKSTKFYDLATSLPDGARLFDDGLYRAVDVYLKAHPWVSESEREKICGVLDCQKLTLEACTHAAQNERLPVRALVQVLFFEQLQLRHAVAGTLISAVDPGRLSGALRLEVENEEEEEGRGECDGGHTWRVTVRENQVLRLDMDSMRTRVHQLERECSSMRKVIENMDKPGPRGGGGWRATLGKKIGCKFNTNVCDSRDPVVADTRKARSHQRPHRE